MTDLETEIVRELEIALSFNERYTVVQLIYAALRLQNPTKKGQPNNTEILYALRHYNRIKQKREIFVS